MITICRSDIQVCIYMYIYISFFQKKIIFRKRNSIVFLERYIQNHGICRTGSILRTLSNMYHRTFGKNSHQVHSSAQASKIKIIHLEISSYTLGKWNFLTLILKRFLVFSQKKAYISRSRNPEKNYYISGN